MLVKVEREIGGQLLSIETGKLARQAHGSAVVRYGDTIVLGTVVSAAPRPGVDFFPLTVDYREKMSAAGKFPGGFFKREGRPTHKEILTMRMIDRPMRPLFPDGFIDEVQIQVMVLSADLQNNPDILGMIAASAAVCASPIPFDGPLGAVRVARVDGKFVINPTSAQMEYSDLEAVLGGTIEAVNMIEVGAREVPDDAVVDAIRHGHEQGVVPVAEMIRELQRQCKVEKNWTPPARDEKFYAEIDRRVRGPLVEAKKIKGKQDRNEQVAEIYKQTVEAMCPADAAVAPDPLKVKDAISRIEEQVVRSQILNDGRRPDGRKNDEIRPLAMEIGWLPRVHGSALFARGETQAMVTVTLGTSQDEQLVDELMDDYSKKFMLHYNFPPFSVGEVRRIGSPGRREIGHGALAEKSLESILPDPETFPYTIRLVSDILESNGSSSMATVCGGTLSLMDAGVPIRAPVAGISIGMVEEDGKHVLLTDIIGEEDHFGDMDFKVAGTSEGVTGVQVDLKRRGLTHKQIKEAVQRARKAIGFLLGEMTRVIDKPRPNISQYAPRILTIKINPEKIGKVIGPGGKGIKGLEADTGAKISIEDDGTVFIACIDADGAERARQAIEAIAEDVQVGRIYEGRVTTVKDFGAFVELTAGQDGLCHISELDDSYVKAVSDVVRIGDRVKVKVIAIDEQGRVKLSRKAALRDGAVDSKVAQTSGKA
ncbi:MAG: Polyribonucleotide nucleotidyltransferase [Phycisphaerae bacterium]|nr:Polyribonucleotide nucleotidyltransferase [Phycisphaerae bacterium]